MLRRSSWCPRPRGLRRPSTPVTLLGAVAAAAVAGTAAAEIVFSGPISVPIVPNFTGTSFNLLTGEPGENPPQDDDADVIFFKLSGEWRLANLDWFEGGGLIGAATGDRVKLLEPGDTVEITPEQPLLEGGGQRTFGDFEDVERAYIGAYFENEDGGTLHYGWVEVTLPSSGPGVITAYAFELTPDTPITIPDPCPADVDASGAVDLDDLLGVLAAFGACPFNAPCPADTDADEAVDLDDLLTVLSSWGPCPG